jgi:hypothetical protein
MMNEKEFLEFLNAHGFVYERVEHPAVFTCAESELHRPAIPAVSTCVTKKQEDFF